MKWTTISVPKKVKERLEEHLEGKESWGHLINRLLDELEESREVRERFGLK